MSRQLKADLALLGVTLGWGASFILTKNCLASLGTYNFLAVRFIIAFAISSLVFYKNMLKLDKNTLKYGILIGFVLFSGFAIQTVGLNYTTASKSAFITGFSVVLVPIISALFLKKFPEKPAIIGAVMALFGLGFLTLHGDLGLNIGDLYTFISAFAFAFHIITVGKYTVDVDSICLAVIQIGVVGFLSLIMSLAIENPIIPKQSDAWLNIFILSLVCTSGAFIVQNTAQKYTSPTHTALIYTGEPVFAAIFAYFVSGEVLSLRGIFGGFLILMGMLVAEIDFKKLITGFKDNKEEAAKN
ncbi:DMT family transporter [Paramaledivibacter caminithermalis]|jgi:drug/metabolite transporter (DMT)-like permease|uniref:Permease of the drug/metabolite transporter (DMT) superfamily n=1 Tax=Paramaledivibacter caminithermalis (strain DSM 15212 / CIP 107654 / DViRD3) TaxID=1121301 RepID=A0A1M6PV04_PARC5|nr:DMT family transporter [Paramaledivibacter caminithermalis]SHK11738.1 Permease of the drug/metabolite transporter (DMT) superfamily [Paramaledivibacter caminithermalis DSM 15212]